MGISNGKKLIIYGSGDFGQLVYLLARECSLDVAAFCSDEDRAVPDETLCGVPFLSVDEILDRCGPNEFSIALGFIGCDLQTTREEKFEHLKSLGFSFPNIIQKGAMVSSDSFGEGNIIFSGVRIGFRCGIGDCNILWQNVSVPHDNLIGDFNNIGPGVAFAGYSKVGSHCFLGANSSLNNGIVVEDRAFVGANAFARRSVQSGSVLVPAQSYVLGGRRSSEFA